jgi:hypothetical protein
MASGSAVRNRSAVISVSTPRGRVEVVRQEMKGLRRDRGWRWFWVARRAGQQDSSTAKEAIRRATLLPARGQAEWLGAAASAAERQIRRLPRTTPVLSPDRTRGVPQPLRRQLTT